MAETELLAVLWQEARSRALMAASAMPLGLPGAPIVGWVGPAAARAVLKFAPGSLIDPIAGDAVSGRRARRSANP